ncbi:MAG: hypothetical protein HY860_01055 [Chlamydiales bacterium]|nr:hypothetical protein [Chlamydiales bacterium]
MINEKMKNRFKTVLFALLGVFCAIGTTPVWAAASQNQEKKDSVDYKLEKTGALILKDNTAV